jgi:hypothetical protein
MLGNKNSTLFMVSRFVKKLGKKLWVWYKQHVCYTSEKIDMVGNFYYMETKGQKNNGVLGNKWYQMSMPS